MEETEAQAIQRLMHDVSRFGFTWSFEWTGLGWITKATDRAEYLPTFARYSANMLYCVKAIRDLVFAECDGNELKERLRVEY